MQQEQRHAHKTSLMSMVGTTRNCWTIQDREAETMRLETKAVARSQYVMERSWGFFLKVTRYWKIWGNWKDLTTVLDRLNIHQGFPGGSAGKESTCSGRDVRSIPGLGRSPGGGHGNPLQCCCLENLIDRGAWWATIHGVSKSQKQLSN